MLPQVWYSQQIVKAFSDVPGGSDGLKIIAVTASYNGYVPVAKRLKKNQTNQLEKESNECQKQLK